MELQSIRGNAEALAGASGGSVRSVVLTIPPFYTVEEKRAVRLAAELAGLKVLSLISDGLAVGLNYAMSRQFPNLNEGGKPEHHMVFDMGAGSTKASVLQFQSRTVKEVGKFNKTIQEVQVLGSGWDKTLGGDALNYLIVDDMVAQFVASDKAKKASVTADKVMAHGRAMAKLIKEAERLRHILSANQNSHASFEGLYDDVDFKYKISRADFETMAAAHAERVGVAIQGALEAANLQMADLDTVILHGGASRTPFVQKELEKLLGGSDKIRTNVNSDEAAVFGAGFRAADISPSFRVKEIRVIEAAGYPVGVQWKAESGKERHQGLWTAVSALGAAPKEVTFTNHEDFSVTFYQKAPPAGSDVGAEAVEAQTKVLTTTNLTASVTELIEKHKCEKADVKFKISARLHRDDGEVDVIKAFVECETEEPEKETLMDGVKNLFGFGKKDEQQQPLVDKTDTDEDAEGTSSPSSEASPAEDKTSDSPASAPSAANPTPEEAEAPDAKASTTKTKQLVVIPVTFTLERADKLSLPAEALQAVKERIKAFEASDKARRLREETLNQLEGYTYKARDLLDGEAFVAASKQAERDAIDAAARDASDWIYGDGAEAPRDELKARLKALQDLVAPVTRRVDEATKRPDAVKGLQEALDKTKEFVDNIKDQIAKREAYVASATAASDSTDTAADAPAAEEFVDLEDEDAGRKTDKTGAAASMEDAMRERGPVPPLYTLEDLRESEELYGKLTAWLAEKTTEQAALGPTDDPALTVQEIEARRAQLDKVGVDLAMKSVRNFEKKTKAGKKQGKKKATTGSGGKGPGAGPKPFTFDFGEDGKMPTQEQLEEMIRGFTAEEAQEEEPTAKGKTEETEETEKTTEKTEETEQKEGRTHEEL
ncbi:hypothetical protein P8C59_005768 [Phyllachora maydis]|nr:hypothetical protein P8C59_005768 [Phyllachora maydis]